MVNIWQSSLTHSHIHGEHASVARAGFAQQALHFDLSFVRGISLRVPKVGTPFGAEIVCGFMPNHSKKLTFAPFRV